MFTTLLYAESIWEGALGGALKGAVIGAIAGPLVWLVLKAQQRWGKKPEDRNPPSGNSSTL